MNKSVVLISLMVMTLTLSVAGMGTMAWFTDETAVEGNSFVTGEVSIAQQLATSVPFDLSGTDVMAPGDTTSGSIVIDNEGNLPIYLKAEIKENSFSGSNYLPEKLDITINLLATEDQVITMNGSLDSLIDSSMVWLDANNEPYIINPDEYVSFEMDVTLSNSTDETYSNATWNGDIVFTAVQSDNQDEFNVVWENPVQ